ncbi:MAG: hypothetical protein AAGB16_07395, partial [Pseudomonadota bacterium]
MIRTPACLLGLGLLGACATQVPYVDRDRSINLLWDLTPQDAKVSTVTASQGDILMTWDAAAKATHILQDGSQLIAAKTPAGSLYCNFDRLRTCYEDRDADERLDHKWTISDKVNLSLRAPIATSPEKLETDLTFDVTSDTEDPRIIFQRKAVLIFDGPREGVLAEDGVTFTTMLGQMLLGWLDDTAPRSPTGETWQRIQVVPFAVISDKPVRTRVNELSLTYSIDAASIDGTISAVLEAAPVQGFSDRGRLTFQVQNPDPNEDDTQESTSLESPTQVG